MCVGIRVKKRPHGVLFLPGQELIFRPRGHALPFGMTLVSLPDWPEGLGAGVGAGVEVGLGVEDRAGLGLGGLELVQLTPQFDLPDGCVVAEGWSAYPRPAGVTLPAGVLLFRYGGDHGGAGLLPPFMRACPMPDLPHGTALPR